MDGNKYNSVLTSIARQGLRKLSEIMRKNLNQTVKIFDGAEERMLRSSLVNCRKWMEGGQVRTYFKILQIVFEIAQ